MPLYPPLEPYETGALQVSSVHTLYWEQSGNPDGKPVVFLHGGPGGGTEGTHRRFFDPETYRIVLFDQRGCGKSKPHAELQDNTTWDLVADIERLRRRLNIERWHVFGGSWGSTLALAYAATHPDRVMSLCLRGIFLLRAQELRWFYQFGCSELFPVAWEKYLAPIPPEEQGALIEAYYQRLTSKDAEVRSQAARAWSVWEAATSRLMPDPRLQAHHDETKFAEAFARIECHYFVNRGFFEYDGYLLDQVPKFRHIPACIVQGRYDVVCPPTTAYALHKAWPEADFQIIPDAGHSAFEAGISEALVRAMDGFRRL